MDFNLTDHQRQLQSIAKEFSDHEIEPRAGAIDREARMPDDLLPKMAQKGLLGMTVSPKYGGTGSGYLNCILAIEQLAYSGTGAWWLAGFNNSIPACIAEHATEEARLRYIPAVCQGTAYASIQFTEESTGSDPDALTTAAIPHGDGFVIRGHKRFSTFGARVGPVVVFTKDKPVGCSAFLISKLAPGYIPGKIWETVGGGGVEPVDIEYRDVEVSPNNLLGQRGEGFNILLRWITVEKVQQCAANVGIAQAALDESLKYSNTRLSKGRPTSSMQGIRWMLADMKANLEAARWMTYRAAFLLDSDSGNCVSEAAAAKVFVVPATMQITEMARRIHGAYGYINGCKIDRLCRAAVGATGVGTSLEINKSIVGASLVQRG